MRAPLVSRFHSHKRGFSYLSLSLDSSFFFFFPGFGFGFGQPVNSCIVHRILTDYSHYDPSPYNVSHCNFYSSYNFFFHCIFNSCFNCLLNSIFNNMFNCLRKIERVTSNAYGGPRFTLHQFVKTDFWVHKYAYICLLSLSFFSFFSNGKRQKISMLYKNTARDHEGHTSATAYPIPRFNQSLHSGLYPVGPLPDQWF